MLIEADHEKSFITTRPGFSCMVYHEYLDPMIVAAILES